MIHKKIRLVLRLIDAVDRKMCNAMLSTPGMNSFRIEDNQITEYRPKIFKRLRSLQGVSKYDLGTKYIFNSNIHSNSGSLFFFSSDFKYIIKTIRDSERQTLLDFVERYYEYIVANPSTLLLKILGCYVLDSISFCSMGCVELNCSHRYNVLIMKNIFRDTNIDRIYDLKGIGLHRDTNCYIKKDLDWCEDNNKPIIEEKVLQQMYKDVQFLEGNNIMDYSLLVYYSGVQGDKHFRLYDVNDPNVYKPAISSKSVPGDCSFGIVDILTKYSCLKKTEWFWNTFCLCKNKSSTNPKEFGGRLKKIVEDTFIIEEESENKEKE